MAKLKKPYISDKGRKGANETSNGGNNNDIDKLLEPFDTEDQESIREAMELIMKIISK